MATPEQLTAQLEGSVKIVLGGGNTHLHHEQAGIGQGDTFVYLMNLINPLPFKRHTKWMGWGVVVDVPTFQAATGHDETEFSVARLIDQHIIPCRLGISNKLLSAEQPVILHASMIWPIDPAFYAEAREVGFNEERLSQTARSHLSIAIAAFTAHWSTVGGAK